MKIFRSKILVWLASVALLTAQDALLAKNSVDILLADDTFSPRFSLEEGYVYRRGGHLIYNGLSVEGLKHETLFWKAKFDWCSPVGHNKCHLYEVDLEANIGYTFRIKPVEELSIAPFIGLGFAYFDIHKGLSRDQNLYLPFGFYINWQPTDAMQIGLRGQANIMFTRSWQWLNVNYQVTRRTVWAAELPLSYKFNSHWDFTLVPFWKYEPAYRIGGLPSSLIPNPTYQLQTGSITTMGIIFEIGYKL